MSHDMSKMGHDTTMKHDMAAMGQGMGEMKSGWKELDAFHTLLMSAWHPALKDSLTMARTLAPTLSTSAAAWEKSRGPAACDNAAARANLARLRAVRAHHGLRRCRDAEHPAERAVRERDAAMLVLNLSTTDGFNASFGLSRSIMGDLAGALADEQATGEANRTLLIN